MGTPRPDFTISASVNTGSFTYESSCDHRSAQLTGNGQLRSSCSTLRDGQPTIRIEVFEQGGSAESERPEDNKLIADGDITNIPPWLP
jgi:hypothetical protein